MQYSQGYLETIGEKFIFLSKCIHLRILRRFKQSTSKLAISYSNHSAITLFFRSVSSISMILPCIVTYQVQLDANEFQIVSNFQAFFTEKSLSKDSLHSNYFEQFSVKSVNKYRLANICYETRHPLSNRHFSTRNKLATAYSSDSSADTSFSNTFDSFHSLLSKSLKEYFSN